MNEIVSTILRVFIESENDVVRIALAAIIVSGMSVYGMIIALIKCKGK